MLSNNALVGALIFILMVLAANAIMYGIARRMSRGGDARWISALKQGLTKPMESQANKSMEELRQKVEQINKNAKKEE
ncbi:MAG: hypothetical protein ACM3PS_11090 [Syntrophothermus sp.]